VANAAAVRIIRRSKKGRLRQRIERMENVVHQAPGAVGNGCRVRKVIQLQTINAIQET
jgi:hypothetical protein